MEYTQKFYELDCEQQLEASALMLAHVKQIGFPETDWQTEEDVARSIGQGYDPDDDFTFYIDDKTNKLSIG